MLNACDTGRGSALDAYSSTAGSLVRRGIPAVVAMQFKISDPAAVCFAQTFYQNVAKRLPVDTSVMRARRALRRAKKDTLEWGTPVLYLRAPDGRVFDTTASAPLASRDEAGERQAQSGQPLVSADAAAVEALYDQALAAFWTERWDQAVDLLQQVLAMQDHHPQAAGKLEHARRQQQLTASYAHACAAADAGEWDQAVAAYAMVAKADPGYRDVSTRLETARRQQQLAGLHAEARRLHQAREWAAVLKVGERMHALDPTAPAPDSLEMNDARDQLARSRRAEQLAADYSTGLRLLEAGKWHEAVLKLERVSKQDPTYRDAAVLLARARRELTASTPAQTRPSRLAEQSTVVQTVRHRKAIGAATFSPDGRWLATGSSDTTARVWAAASGKELRKFNHGPGATVTAVAFSSDGRRLATSSKASTADIWDAASGREIRQIKHGNGFSLYAVAFSPDGRWLATGSFENTARIWDSGTGREIQKLTHNRIVNAVAFSPDGRWLATGSIDNTARIWDSGRGREIRKLTHNGAVNAVAFSPDGRWLATGSADKTARIWDSGSGREIRKLTHNDEVNAVAFSPDGRWLATGSFDNTARIWDSWDSTSSHELLKLTHNDAVNAVAFSPDGRWLATGSADKTARIWVLVDSHDD